MKRIILFIMLLFSVVLSTKAQKPTQNAEVMQMVADNSGAIGITKDQLSKLKLSSTYAEAGTQYVYLIQTVQGIPVYNQMLVLAFKNKKLVSNAGTYNPAFEVNVPSATPARTAADAVNAAFREAKVASAATGGNVSANDPYSFDFGSLPGVSNKVTATLLWQPVSLFGNTQALPVTPKKGILAQGPVMDVPQKNSPDILRAPVDKTGKLPQLEAENNKPGEAPEIDIAKIKNRNNPKETQAVPQLPVGITGAGEGKQSLIRLVWQVEVAPAGTDDHWLIYIDAAAGLVIGKINLTLYEHAHEQELNKTGDIFGSHEAGATNRGQGFAPAPPTVTAGQYNVVPLYFEAPSFKNFEVVTNPWLNAGATNNATTNGWHFDGTTNHDSTKGNNVDAYLDILNNNTPGPVNRRLKSTTASPSLTFNHSYDPVRLPSNDTTRNLTLTNLFYWNNIVHDITYQYGFTEAAGNFQNDNIGRGGVAGDYVRAEAQDANGTNNANFTATFNDGTVPRMQMFLFTAGTVTRTFKVNSPAAIAGTMTIAESNFNPTNQLTATGPVTGKVVFFDDPNGTTHEACSGRPLNDIDGKIALIYRGNCAYADKVKEAQNAGAIAVIMINNVAGSPVVMGGTDNSITIPAVMVSDVDGAKLVAQLSNNVNVTLSAVKNGNPDGDMDNGIIVHQYTHGISNRLTGGPVKTSGCLFNAEQGGEGWSDYFALMMTTDWSKATVNDGPKPRGIGSFASGQPTNGPGIREVPYSTDMSVNPLTYSHVQAAGGQVHRIGTLWCSALWDMTWGIIQQENAIEPNLYNAASANGGNVIAFKLVHEGLKLQPCSPGFLDARDAIIRADVENYGGRHACTIWQAFARRGMGFSAVQGSSDVINDQVQAFDMPTTARFNTQPTDASVCTGGTATFTVSVYVPVPPVTYQWQKSTDGGTSWNNIAGATTTSYTTPVTTAADNGSKYRLVVTATAPCVAGSVNSNAATLNIVTASAGGTLSPANGGLCAVPTASGTLTLSGHSGSIVRWEQSANGGTTWTNITNTTTTHNYNVSVTTQFRVWVEAGACATGAYSSVATITVNPSAAPLSIIADPSTTVCLGDPTKLTVMEGPVSSITTGNTAANAGAGATFNFRNNNNYPVIITDISSMTYIGGSNIQIYYNTTGITARPTSISAAAGWQRLFAGPVATGLLSMSQIGTGLNLVIPANTTYGMYVESTGGLLGNNLVFATTTSSTPVTSSAGNCDIITGGTVGVATSSAAPTSGIYSNIVLFQGIVKFKAASTVITTGTINWTPAAGLNNTTTAVVAASPTTNTTYTVTHNDGAGCIRQASIPITVNARPAITAQPVNATACEKSNATFNVAATGAGLTYQWEVSTDNCVTYSPVSGATGATLTLASVTRTMNGNGYRCKIQGACTPSLITDCVKLKVDTLPVLAITPTGVVCGGLPGVSGTQLSVIDPVPPPTITTATFSSSTSVTVPDNTATGATSTIAVTGIPAGAVITKLTVTLNMSHSYPGDMIINLKSPNLPAITNLYKYGTGAATGNASGPSTWGWYGAQVADGGVAFSTVAASPYIYGATTVYKPDGIIANVGTGAVQNPNGYVATATNLAALQGASPNGTWTLAMADGGAGDIGTLSGWSIKIEYTMNAGGVVTYTWAPATGLYTNNTATTMYATGSSVPSVYAAPLNPTSYIVSATSGSTGCVNKATVSVNNTPQAYITQFDSPVCLGATVRLINRTPSSAPPVWSPAAGLYTDANATVPYTAGTPRDTVWAKPLTTPAVYNVDIKSEADPSIVTMTNGGSATAASAITFNVRNNNGFPVILNEVGTQAYPSTSNISATLWYKASAINGPTGPISAANGWTQAGTGTITGNGNIELMTFVKGLTLQIPANTTYGFVLTGRIGTGEGLVIRNGGTTTISSGIVDILSGANVSYAGTALPPAEPAIAGYSFYGNVKITPLITPACTAPAQPVTLRVNAPVAITKQPVNASVCIDKTVSFTTEATGTNITHNWRVSTNGGVTWADVANSTLYSGAKTATLTITSPPMSMIGYQYKDSITTQPCAGLVSNIVTLSVNALPAPQITASDVLIIPGQTSTITASSTPAAAANGWTWTRNGSPITGTASTQSVGIDQLGVYQARVTDVNGCSALSNELVIGAKDSDVLWIYPNPSQGVFNIRLYFNNTLVSERRVVTVYDMLGQRVTSKEFDMTNVTPPYMEMTFDLSKMAAGTYLVKVTDRFTTKTASGLLVIQH